MGFSRIDYSGETLIDLSGDSVTPETLAEGATAHNANGEQITGIATFGNNGGSSSIFKVTATANFTSETGGILTNMSHTFAEIEVANQHGENIVLDIDISQITPNQRVTLCLFLYADNAILAFSGSGFTGDACLQASCILMANGSSTLFLKQLVTLEDLLGLGGGSDNSFKVTADYSPSMDSNGNFTIDISNLSSTFAEIKTAYALGKDISLVGQQTNSTTNDFLFFNMVSIGDGQILFSSAVFLGAAFLLVGFTLNQDNSTSVFLKTIT